VTIKKKIWIPLALLVLVGILSAAAWWYVPEYAERKFTEKLSEVGIETDSIEFRIEGLSRPVVRNLSLRISGVNLVAESIEFGSLFDGYGDEKPLKITVHGLWAGVNAQIPEGIISVNNAILALPEKIPFQAPLPMEIHFKDGVVLYENHQRQIEGNIEGKLFVENTRVDWELGIDVRNHPINGRGFFNWATGLMDISGEMDLSYVLSQAIWDILNEEPFFDWKGGRIRAAFRFEGEEFRYENGQLHAVLSEMDVGFDSVDLLNCNQVVSAIWTPGQTTLDFTGNGLLGKLLDAPFDWQGSLSVEPGPNLQFNLNKASISPAWEFGSVQLSQVNSDNIPLEVSILSAESGFDFQVLGLDLDLGSELGEQLGSATIDLMLNGHLEEKMLKKSSADLWIRDGMVITPMFQAEIAESLLNMEFADVPLSREFFAAIVAKPDSFIRHANVSNATLYRYEGVVGEGIEASWMPGEEYPVRIFGDFTKIGEVEFSVQPRPESTLRNSSGLIVTNPGGFSFDYQLELDPATGLEARLSLVDYAIQEYPDLDRWMTGDFDITGLLSGNLKIEATPESSDSKIDFKLEEVLYAGGNLVLDNVSFAGEIDSLQPFSLKTVEPLKVSAIQMNGWTATDLSTEIEIGNRINISNSSFLALGGSMNVANISMSRDEMFIDSEIGVNNLQTDEILKWIPKVIGMAEGSIMGVIPFQWDIKNRLFLLGRGHLHSPEGELGFMNLKIFRPEKEGGTDEVDDRYSMVDEALSNLQDSSLDIDILPPSGEFLATRVRLNIKGFVDSRLVKAPVDVVRYYDLPVESFNLTMEQMRQDLPGFRTTEE
jgi:hypothetical protein